MSTILKALRRLEEDRDPLVERPLREQVARAHGDQAKAADASPERSGRGRIVLVGVLAVVVAVGAGALAFLSVRNESTQLTANTLAERPSPPPRREAQPRSIPSREELAARKAQAVQRSAQPTALPAREAVERGLPADALASEVKVIDRPMPGPRLADPDAPAEVGDAPPPQAGPGRVARSQPYSEPVVRSVAAPPDEMAGPRSRSATGTAPARPSPAAEPEPQPVAQADVVEVEVAAVPRAPATPKVEKVEPIVAKPAEPTPANTVAPEPEAAAPKAKAPEPKPAPIIQALAPSVRVEQTRWHPDPTRRTALLEVDGGPQEVQEGDSLGSLVVTKIEPSGVVFTKDGVELRRRIGE